MQRETTISRWCARIIEACWVLALTLVPIYFNLFTARHFEPDKATTLRSLVVIAATMGLIRAIESLNARSTAPPPTDGPSLWRRFAAIPLSVPALVYALVFLFTTATSVVPGTSFWGSYQRLQGTYTNLSYILLFVLIVATVRTRVQIERIITITMISGVTAAGYGVLQHLTIDPLPWQGDVISRVASTLGNSIFVAAFLILVTPLALYRCIAALGDMRTAAPSTHPLSDWLWTLVRALLLICGIVLLLSVIKFGAAVRTIDFRYWWVFPGAVISATGLWWILTTDFDRVGKRIPLWPGILTLGYLLLFGVQFNLSAAPGVQVSALPKDAPNAADWWIWLFVSIGCGVVGYGMAFFLPSRSAQPSRMSIGIGAIVSAAAALLVMVATVFTQSRGPFIGLGAGMFVFFTLLLWAALRRVRADETSRLAGRLRALLIGWVSVTVLAAIFLAAFNFSGAPVFDQLRKVPYLGRLGTLTEADSGTGLVRRLIWAGDAHGGGAIGLITSNPLRAIIGWGPESMFVAFNPFFPPSLSNVEARGASPDRSHQAILDELVTKGVLGLASYLFLLISFFVLAIKLMLRSQDWRWQVLFIASISLVVCHVVEGATGIPIVATLMLLWVALAITVAGGALDGHYRLSLRPVPVALPEAEDESSTAERKRQGNTGGQRGSGTRVVTGRSRVSVHHTARGESRAPAMLAYAALLLVALWFTWAVNIAPVYADMLFQQAQGSDRAGIDLNQMVTVLDDYIGTVRSSPGEDFYYLSLGRALMTTGDALRTRNVPLGKPIPNANVLDLINLANQDAVAGLIQRSTPLSMMSYAEAVLLKAHDLNPLNKDHFANLGRLNNYWYGITRDPERLRLAISWYEKVTPIAPNDVTLINERAGVVATLGDYTESAGNKAQAQTQYDQAVELLHHSEELDSRYGDTYLRLGDLEQRRGGDLAKATDFYVKAIELTPTAAVTGIQNVIDSMSAHPDLIGRLHDAFAVQAQKTEDRLTNLERIPEQAATARTVRGQVALLQSVVGLLSVRAGNVDGSREPYQRAAALQPTNVEYSRNYTIVLSDTRHYDEAIAETNRLIAALQAAGQTDKISQVQQLLQIVQAAKTHP
jgi:tetratricopeptide (TPR) repeat protein